MRWLSKWRAAARERVRTLLFRKRAESDLDEELRFHLEMEADKLARSRGLQPDEARRRAAVAFGGVERYKEEVRHARGLAWLSGTRLDFILGARMLVKYPALALVGGLGMAVAIAVSVGFFAFIRAHAYPELPLEEGDRIVALENRDMTVNNEERRSLHDFVLWRSELRSIVELGAFRTVERNLVPEGGPPVPVPVAEMTASGFTLARVPPLLGRHLVAADEQPGAPRVVVIGYDVWQSRFGGDPGIVGRELRFGRTIHTIVGVMPEDFGFPEAHTYWVPLHADPQAFARRDGPAIFIFGRLAPGTTMEEAQAELDAIGQRTAAAFPESNATLRPMVMPYVHSLTDIQGTTPWMFVQMQLMVSLLLVVVALNVAVLVYARTATRQGEIAVRTALGASRSRIVMQLFVEALILALGAATVGVALAHVGFQLGNKIMEQEMSVPFWANYSLRLETVLFAVGTAVFAAVIIGVLPALQATGRRLRTGLGQLSGSSVGLGKTWTILIVGQVAIAVAALPAAVNMGWSEIRNAMTRPTYRAEEFLVAEIRMEPGTDAGTPEDAGADSVRFGQRLASLLTRLEAEPTVAGATYASSLRGRTGRIEVEGVAAPTGSPTGHRVVSDGVALNYLDVYGARLLTGRGFGAQDLAPEATAIIVDQTFVRTIMGGESPLGRRVRHLQPTPTDAADAEPIQWYEVVGVVENMHVNHMDPAIVRPVVFYPVAPSRVQEVSLEVRLRGSTPADFAPRLRELTMDVDPLLRLGTTYSRADFERQDRLAMQLIALVISLVLVSVFLLSAAGIYALTSFTVTRRRKEIGIRTALGALPGQVLRSVFGRVARQVALGLAIGVGGAALVDQVTGGGLLGGRATVLLPVFAVTMTVVALLAAFGPARRGLRIEPTEALRADS